MGLNSRQQINRQCALNVHPRPKLTWQFGITILSHTNWNDTFLFLKEEKYLLFSWDFIEFLRPCIIRRKLNTLCIKIMLNSLFNLWNGRKCKSWFLISSISYSINLRCSCKTWFLADPKQLVSYVHWGSSGWHLVSESIFNYGVWICVCIYMQTLT